MSITLKNKQTGSPIPSTKPVPGGLNVDLHITNTSSQDLSLKCVVMGAERTLLPVASAELQAGETRCIGSFTTPEGERRVVVKCLMQQEEQYFQSHCVIPVWVLTPNYECMQTHLQAKINALSKEEKAQLEEKNKLEDELRKRIEITEEMAIEKECLRKEREQLFAEKEKLARELNDLQKKMQEVQLTGKECPLSKPAQNLSNIFGESCSPIMYHLAERNIQIPMWLRTSQRQKGLKVLGGKCRIPPNQRKWKTKDLRPLRNPPRSVCLRLLVSLTKHYTTLTVSRNLQEPAQ